ncbi:uncharacterized protein [Miscanthus floridulus]|uniref:uncharacterized protein n=1 Tax=Miscanthus floridulus TaxID=154761 RepID=UPI003458A7FA
MATPQLSSVSAGSRSALAVFSILPYAKISVKSHVPITLELKRPNFTRWSAFFLSLCGKFGLRPHVDDMLEARPDDKAWQQPTPVSTTGSSANKASRAIFLSHEFYSMTQGDLSIDDYNQKMKTTADALRDIGHTIVDLQLVLNPCFSRTADNITDPNPLP